jgi:MoxR-like ATPase
VSAIPLFPDGDVRPVSANTARAQSVVANVEQVVHGRTRAVELVACALFSGGHALVEDIPGTGKTTLARAFARSLGGVFHRIQATADLLPSDITGSGVWDADVHAFRFVPGPVFGHVVLVDELNRTPPRTQSAFLEAMDEGAVTVDGQRHALPEPFFMIATQNPLEQHGTFPLPEGQLDRFATCLRLGSLDLASERQVVREQLVRATVDDLEPVISIEQLQALRTAVRSTYVADPALDYCLSIVRATRQDPRVRIGASSRAAISLVRCAQARAVLQGREYVVPDDIKTLAGPVLAHRLVLAQRQSGAPDQLVNEIVELVPVPLRP